MMAPPEAAELYFRHAIDVAREQDTIIWQLRASIDLARLWQDKGRNDEAIALVKPVYDSIAIGDCPKDRAIAEAFLNEKVR